MPLSILQFHRDGNRLLVSHLRGAERADNRPFEDTGLLETWARAYADLMEKALAFPLNDHRSELADFGRCLYDNLLEGPLTDALPKTEGRTVLVDLPESLLWFPVEALFDGEAFFGTRYSLGRRITNWESYRPPARARRDGHTKPTLLLVAGYAEDKRFFEETRHEIYELCDLARDSGAFEIRELLVDNNLRRSDLLRELSAADYIHFSGHGDSGLAAPGENPNANLGGWLFKEYHITPRDISELRGCDPFFVFSNSCRSSATANWRETGDLVRAFWEQGTRHFIGANTRVHFRRAAEFSEAFYKSYMAGETIGESMRRARLFVHEDPSHHDPSWLSYVLCGNPSAKLNGHDEDSVPFIEKVSQTNGEGQNGAGGTAPAGSAADSSPIDILESLRGGRGGGRGSAGGIGSTDTHLIKCAWSGTMVPRSTAVPCVEPGCPRMLGMEAQLKQRRAALDRAYNGDAQTRDALMAGRRPVWCPDHMPQQLSDWIERSEKASAVIASGEDACAWTGEKADRADLLSGKFRKTPFGLMSPAAVKQYICAETGEIIPPELAKAGRGWIEHEGEPLSERGYWLRLEVDNRSEVSRDDADKLEARARRKLTQRLRRLGEFEYDGTIYEDVELADPDTNTPEEWAALMSASGGILRGINIGLVHRLALNPLHHERFGHDRLPLEVGLARQFQQAEPPKVRGAKQHVVLLASPTGWSSQAREAVRQTRPAKRLAYVLKDTGPNPKPLAFHPSLELVEALKIDLAGGML